MAKSNHWFLKWPQKKYLGVILSVMVWFSIVVLRINNFLVDLDLGAAVASATIYTLACVGYFYLNYLVLIPRFFKERKYWAFYGWSIFFLVLLAMFLHGVEKNVFLEMYSLSVDTNLVFRKRVFGNNLFLLLSVFFSILIYRQSENRRLVGNQKELKKLNYKAELKLLKSQINPHFLFNALNGIYSLSLMKSEKTPLMVMKLSEMLRYILYDVGTGKVTLEKEIAYVRNYIHLQELKSENEQNISLDIEGLNGTLQVEPMLIQPLIENSFKHSKIEDSENGWIRIKVATPNGNIEISVENSVPDVSYTKDKVGGIGLENIKKRLELLYPEKHHLSIKNNTDCFSVNLIIQNS